MKSSPAPGKELDLAAEAIAAMQNARSIEIFERAWKSYLHHIERCFFKATAHYQKSPKWGGWHGKFVTLRKKDPLLLYLRQARGADEHTVEDIISQTPGSLSISAPAGSNTLFIRSLKVDEKGKILLDAPRGAMVIHTPAETKLLPVVNHGTTFPVPEEHLGKAINPTNVPEIALLALAFYRAFLGQAEEFFIT